MRRRAFGSVGHEVQLRADEYRLLRDLVHERLGIWFGPESRLSLERRLRERLVANGLDGFADYHQFLKYSPLAAHEWDEAAELLTTNETYFFREDYQLRAFKNELLPMLAEKNPQRRRVRIWSAGCSTGEEPYTIGQWRADAASGRLKEAFACGTAAVISPIGKVCSASGDFEISGGVAGPVAMRLRKQLVDIQYGRAADTHNWIRKVL